MQHGQNRAAKQHSRSAFSHESFRPSQTKVLLQECMPSQGNQVDAEEALLQAASEMYVSDAAMDATLNGRAEYARILADLGFVSAEYAARCNSPSIAEDDQDAMSGNARVIKAAICAGTSALHCRAVRLFCAYINMQCPEGLDIDAQ